MVCGKRQAVNTFVIWCWFSDHVRDVHLKSSYEVNIHHSDRGYVVFSIRYMCSYFIPLWFLHDCFFVDKLTWCGVTSQMRCLYKIRGIAKPRILPEVWIFSVLLPCFGRCFIMSCLKLWGVFTESILLPQFGSYDHVLYGFLFAEIAVSYSDLESICWSALGIASLWYSCQDGAETDFSSAVEEEPYRNRNSELGSWKKWRRAWAAVVPDSCSIPKWWRAKDTWIAAVHHH